MIRYLILKYVPERLSIVDTFTSQNGLFSEIPQIYLYIAFGCAIKSRKRFARCKDTAENHRATFDRFYISGISIENDTN